MPSQHALFSNQDVLAVVFHHLATSSSRKDLLRSALTCKSCLEPALDALWSSLSCLFPLLRLLPTFTSIHGTYVLDGIIQDDDWKRFDVYARRVRTLSIGPSLKPIANHVYCRIGFLRPTPLIPCLRHLHFRHLNSAFDTSAAFFLLSDTLQTIEFDDVGLKSLAFIQPFLSTLASRRSSCVMLRRLAIRGQCTVPDVFESLTYFNHLQSLELRLEGAMPFDLLWHFGKLPWLSDLSVYVGTGVEARSRRNCATHPRYFSSIETLHLTGGTTRILSILEQMDLEILRTITISLDQTELSTGLTLIECVRELYNSPLLDTVNITSSSNHISNSNCALEIDLLPSLCQLHQLNYLTIDLPSLCITTQKATELANSLVNLRKLYLPVQHNLATPDIEVLRSISTACNKLEALQLSFDIHCVPLLPMPLSSHPLKSLSVSTPQKHLSHTQLEQVANYINRLYPRLETIRACQASQSDCEGLRCVDQWRQIHGLICQYRARTRDGILLL